MLPIIYFPSTFAVVYLDLGIFKKNLQRLKCADVACSCRHNLNIKNKSQIFFFLKAKCCLTPPEMSMRKLPQYLTSDSKCFARME